MALKNTYAKYLGRRGGKKTTPAKAEAARRNAKLATAAYLRNVAARKAAQAAAKVAQEQTNYTAEADGLTQSQNPPPSTT